MKMTVNRAIQVFLIVNLFVGLALFQNCTNGQNTPLELSDTKEVPVTIGGGPLVESVAISGGVNCVNSRQLPLVVKATEANKILVSETYDFVQYREFEYKEGRVADYLVSPVGDFEERIVYVKVVDSSGVESEVHTFKYIYDFKDPVVVVAWPTVGSIVGNSNKVGVDWLTLESCGLRTDSASVSVKFSNDLTILDAKEWLPVGFGLANSPPFVWQHPFNEITYMKVKVEVENIFGRIGSDETIGYFTYDPSVSDFVFSNILSSTTWKAGGEVTIDWELQGPMDVKSVNLSYYSADDQQYHNLVTKSWTNTGAVVIAPTHHGTIHVKGEITINGNLTYVQNSQDFIVDSAVEVVFKIVEPKLQYRGGEYFDIEFDSPSENVRINHYLVSPRSTSTDPSVYLKKNDGSFFGPLSCTYPYSQAQQLWSYGRGYYYIDEFKKRTRCLMPNIAVTGGKLIVLSSDPIGNKEFVLINDQFSINKITLSHFDMSPSLQGNLGSFSDGTTFIINSYRGYDIHFGFFNSNTKQSISFQRNDVDSCAKASNGCDGYTMRRGSNYYLDGGHVVIPFTCPNEQIVHVFVKADGQFGCKNDFAPTKAMTHEFSVSGKDSVTLKDGKRVALSYDLQQKLLKLTMYNVDDSIFMVKEYDQVSSDRFYMYTDDEGLFLGYPSFRSDLQILYRYITNSGVEKGFADSALGPFYDHIDNDITILKSKYLK